MEIKTVSICALLLIVIPSVVTGADEEQCLLLFEKYNEALKDADTHALEKYMGRIQFSVLKECLADPICGKSRLAGMKNGALSQYTITNFVEYEKGYRIVKIRDPNLPIDKVNGPAVQLYFEGVTISGSKVVGHATMGVEDGAKRVIMTTWGAP